MQFLQRLKDSFSAFLAKERQKDPKQRFHDMMIGGLVALCGLISAVCLVSTLYTKRQTAQIVADAKVAQEEQDNEQAMVDQLKNQTELLKDDDYVAKLARSRYYLSKDGEIIFSLPEDNDSKQAQNDNQSYQAMQEADHKAGGQ